MSELLKGGNGGMGSSAPITRSTHRGLGMGGGGDLTRPGKESPPDLAPSAAPKTKLEEVLQNAREQVNSAAPVKDIGSRSR